MVKIKIKLVDGTEITTDDRSGSPIHIEGDIGQALEEIKKNNSPISFSPTNGKPFTVQGKDLKSIEFII